MREGTGENPGHRTGGGSERCWAGSLCYRYGRDKELVAKAAAETVYSGIGVRRGVAEAGWNLGQFRAVLARIAGRCGGFRMKIVSRCANKRGGRTMVPFSRSKRKFRLMRLGLAISENWV